MKEVAIPSYDDNRDCTLHITSLLLLLFQSNILKWCFLYQIILFIRREALTKCNAYDFSFANFVITADTKTEETTTPERHFIYSRLSLATNAMGFVQLFFLTTCSMFTILRGSQALLTAPPFSLCQHR